MIDCSVITIAGKEYTIKSETRHHNGQESVSWHAFEDRSYVSGTTSGSMNETIHLLHSVLSNRASEQFGLYKTKGDKCPQIIK